VKTIEALKVSSPCGIIIIAKQLKDAIASNTTVKKLEALFRQ
jgi:translation initiation factor 1 (eIF-1/SUI1)